MKKSIIKIRRTKKKLVPPPITDPKVEAMVREIIERVADKWTMLVLEVWRSMEWFGLRGSGNSWED